MRCCLRCIEKTFHIRPGTQRALFLRCKKNDFNGAARLLRALPQFLCQQQQCGYGAAVVDGADAGCAHQWPNRLKPEHCDERCRSKSNDGSGDRHWNRLALAAQPEGQQREADGNTSWKPWAVAVKYCSLTSAPALARLSASALATVSRFSLPLGLEIRIVSRIASVSIVPPLIVMVGKSTCRDGPPR